LFPLEVWPVGGIRARSADQPTRGSLSPRGRRPPAAGGCRQFARTACVATATGPLTVSVDGGSPATAPASSWGRGRTSGTMPTGRCRSTCPLDPEQAPTRPEPPGGGETDCRGASRKR